MNIMPDDIINKLTQDEPTLMAQVPAGALQRGADQISAAATDMFHSITDPERGR